MTGTGRYHVLDKDWWRRNMRAGEVRSGRWEIGGVGREIEEVGREIGGVGREMEDWAVEMGDWGGR